jgi:FAD/FMN-containing dehydrogenase
MTATKTAARIGTTDWNLTGIRTTAAGETCGHCGRTLRNLYDVRNAITGQTLTVGRGCCKKVTGWNLELAEARNMLRYAEAVARRAAKWAAFAAANPELAAVIDADAKLGRPNAHSAKYIISDRAATGWDRRTAQNYVRDFRAAA